MPKITISANTLFHFTDQMTNLEGILEKEFSPRYCLEDYRGIFPNLLDPYDERAIPMVSFCDIPLSQIKNHIRVYGGYGIGLSKDWGMKNGISPILYRHNKSNSTVALNNALDMIVKQLWKDTFIGNTSVDNGLSLETLIQQLDSIACFTKPYKGPLIRKGNIVKKSTVFYNEREWRFIPNIVTLAKNEISFALPKHAFINDIERVKLENLLAVHCKLSFKPKDIKYIIVKKESEIIPMIAKIREYKHKYSQDDQDRLVTKIITLNDILNDF